MTQHPRSSVSDVEYYLSSVRAAIVEDDAFREFRRLPGIAAAIDGVPASEGSEYRSIVLAQTPHLLQNLQAFKRSDECGSPLLALYPEGHMSPTTWRYIKVLSDLQLLFGDLSNWKIAEIGAGYGGQLKIISDVYRFSTYSVFDLQEVNNLVSKFLKFTRQDGVRDVDFYDYPNLTKAEGQTFDLVISNWALSECTSATQERYIKQVLRRSHCGYITYNQISHLCGIDSYTRDEFMERLGFPVEIMPEGLSAPIPKEIEQSIIHWKSQPYLT